MKRKLSFRNFKGDNPLEIRKKIEPYMKHTPDNQLVKVIDELLNHKYEVYTAIEENILYVIITNKLNVKAMTN